MSNANNPLNPGNLNQGAQNLNQLNSNDLETNTAKIIANLNDSIARTTISNITDEIAAKTDSYQKRMESLSANFEDDPSSLPKHFAQRMNFCEESLLDLREVAYEAKISERILIQDLFESLQHMPEAFDKFAKINSTNGALEITQDGESLLNEVERFMALRADAGDFIIDNPSLVSFNLNDEMTEDYWQEIVQVYLQHHPEIQNISLTEILDSFEIDNQYHNEIINSLLMYEEQAEEIYKHLKDSHEKFVNDIVMLNEGEAYRRVLNQEKINLSQKLGFKVQIGNQFKVYDSNGNYKTYIIRGIQFKSAYFDAQRDLLLDCELVESFDSNDILDNEYSIDVLPQTENKGIYSAQLDESILDNYQVYPKCESFMELEERLGFRSMNQVFQPGTLFSYRLDKSTSDLNYTEVLNYDVQDQTVVLSRPIPTYNLDGKEFESVLKNLETDTRILEYQVNQSNTDVAYEYSIEDFLNFAYRYQAEQHVEAKLDPESNSLIGDQLDQMLVEHHEYMVSVNLAVSKDPIVLKPQNILGNIQGDKYEIKSVGQNSIVLENLSYPKFNGDNPDLNATLQFTLPELLKFIKDQNLGMVPLDKVKRQWGLNVREIQGIDFPDLEMPELPFGLMSMKDIMDMAGIFGEQYTKKLERKRALRLAGFQAKQGQQSESLQSQNEKFNERVDFYKSLFEEQGNSNTWSNHLADLTDANFRNQENRAKLKALIDLLADDGSLSPLDENFIKLINKARRQTKEVVTDPIKKKITYDKDGSIKSEDWLDRDGTRNEDAVAEALNYIFNNNGQPSNFGTQCISKNRSAFTSSMNESKSKTERLAKELKMDFDGEFSRLFANLGQGKPMDAGEYTGILQAMVDGGYQDLEVFFYYLYAGLCHTMNGNGPILDDQFIESLNYGDHPFFHAFTAHKDLLYDKREEIWAGFSASSNKLPQFKGNKAAKDGVQKFIWSYMLPLSTASTKKHFKTAEGMKYAKEYPGFVLSKLSNIEIENLFKVGVETYGGLNFGGETNFNKHKDAFAQYAAGFKYASDFAKEHSAQNNGTYIRNLLTSSIALFGITHGRYKTHTQDGKPDRAASQRAFTEDQISELRSKGGTDDFLAFLTNVASNCGIDASLLLEKSSSHHLDSQQSSLQAERLINHIRRLSTKELTDLVEKSQI